MDIIIFLANILNFLNYTVIPFTIAIAGLVFIWNAARYFIIQSAEEEARRRARSLALWGIIAFVFLLSVWGIINILVRGLGFNTDIPLNSDYVEERGFGGGGGQNANQITCTELFGGFSWCSESETQVNVNLN